MGPIARIRTRITKRRKTERNPVVMFDFDGVIADSFEIFYTEFTGAVRELGYDKLDSKEALLKLFEGNAFKSLVKMGFPVWKLRQLGEQFKPRIEAANERIEPFEGMIELLGDLAAAHPTYVITSNQTAAVESFLERYAVQNIIEVLGSDKEPSKVKKIRQVRKRHPEHNAWYIGDTKGDMIEANTAGATSVAAGWGWHPVETLREGKPDHVVMHHSDLRILLLPAERA
ncbi:MAG: HAD hydrolase-like protein [Candidatus Hydrogenedens sp.]|nr:HAD hydrolase-like protein [Candidatus Hydrogenedens sp.]